MVAFSVHAAVAGSLGPRIPALKEQAGLSAGSLGVSLTGYALGLFAGTRLAGGLVRRFGSRHVIRTGIPIQCLALVTLALGRTLPSLAGAFIVVGVVSGVLDVAMNSQAVAVERGYRRPIMSSTHASWSAAMLAGSLVGAGAAALGVPLFLHFGLLAVVLGVASVRTLGGLLPSDATELVLVESTGPPEPSLRAMRSAAVLVLGLIAFSSFLGEGAAVDWSAVYLRDGLRATAGVAGLGFVAFSAGMTASRLVADRLSSRFGPDRVLRAGGLTAAASLTVGLVVHDVPATIAALALMGSSLGPVVPITFSAAGNTRGPSTGAVLGWVVTIGYLGSIVGPFLIGFAAEWASLRWALAIPAALGLVIFLAGGRARSSPPSAGV